MKQINVDLKENSYKIYIESGLIDSIGEKIKAEFKTKKIAIVTDDKVDSLYGDLVLNNLIEAGYETSKIVFKNGEESKNSTTLQYIYENLVAANLNRDSIVIALGGGVVGDITGFAASTYLRGVKFIQIPTTILAQVDSSVGGKVAINIKEGKNLIGSFYQPSAVYIDPNLVKTLEDRVFSDGMSEVIKYAFIRDKKLYDILSDKVITKNDQDLLSEIIYRCCDTKKVVVQNDEKDLGERMILNFGHTLGHAIEKYYNYANYTHGEAVAIGMYNITILSEKKELTKQGTSLKIKELLEKYNLPYEMPKMEFDKILDTVLCDKKIMDKGLSFILVSDVGECFIHNVSSNSIKDFLGEIK